MAPKPKSKCGRTHKQIAEDNVEKIIEMIRNGVSYRKIAAELGIDDYEIVRLVNDSTHSARALQAKKLASYDLLDKAEQEIRAIQDHDTAAAVRRQVELMNITLYKAKIKNREELDLNYREKDNNQQQIVVIPADYMNQKKIA